MQAEIPPPIIFNPYKHHFRFLLSEIEEWKAKGWVFAYEQILKVGNNLIDFYLGNLSVEQMADEASNALSEFGINTKLQYDIWLGTKK